MLYHPKNRPEVIQNPSVGVGNHPKSYEGGNPNPRAPTIQHFGPSNRILVEPVGLKHTQEKEIGYSSGQHNK